MNIWPLMFLQFLIYFLPIRESTKCKDTVVITRLWSTAKVATRLTEHCILLYAVLQPGIVLKPMMSTRAKFPSDSFRWNVNILSGTTLLSSLPDKSLSSEASLPLKLELNKGSHPSAILSPIEPATSLWLSSSKLFCLWKKRLSNYHSFVFSPSKLNHTGNIFGQKCGGPSPLWSTVGRLESWTPQFG